MNKASLSTEDRTTYLGASEIAAVAGIDPYKSPLDIWYRKCEPETVKAWEEEKRREESSEKQGLLPYEVGLALELSVLDAYQKKYSHSLSQEGTIRCKQHVWAAATPDAIANMGGAHPIVVQAKCVGRNTRYMWGDPSQGDRAIPSHVMAQVTWEQMCTDLREAHVVALLDPTDITVYEIKYDEELADVLFRIGEHFWTKYVQTKTPPPPTAHDSDLLTKRFPKPLVETIEPTEEIDYFVHEFFKAQEEKKKWDEKCDYFANHVRARLGEAAACHGADYRVSWTERTSTKWKKIAEELHASKEMINTHSSTSRTLLIKHK